MENSNRKVPHMENSDKKVQHMENSKKKEQHMENTNKKVPHIEFKHSLPEDMALANEEMEVFGINHAKVGAAMMRDWGFPDEIVVPLLNQFEPSESGKHERMACLVSFAKRMVSTIVNDPSCSAVARGPDPLLIALLHLTKEEYLKVVEQLRLSYGKAESLVSNKKAPNRSDVL